MHIFQKVAMGSAERYMGAKYYIQFISRQEAESPEKKIRSSNFPLWRSQTKLDLHGSLLFIFWWFKIKGLINAAPVIGVPVTCMQRPGLNINFLPRICCQRFEYAILIFSKNSLISISICVFKTKAPKKLEVLSVSEESGPWSQTDLSKSLNFACDSSSILLLWQIPVTKNNSAKERIYFIFHGPVHHQGKQGQTLEAETTEKCCFAGFLGGQA